MQRLHLSMLLLSLVPSRTLPITSDALSFYPMAQPRSALSETLPRRSALVVRRHREKHRPADQRPAAANKMLACCPQVNFSFCLPADEQRSVLTTGSRSDRDCWTTNARARCGFRHIGWLTGQPCALLRRRGPALGSLSCGLVSSSGKLLAVPSPEPAMVGEAARPCAEAKLCGILPPSCEFLSQPRAGLGEPLPRVRSSRSRGRG